MEASIIDRLVEEAERFPEKRRRLSAMLASDIASEPHLRSLLLEGLLREVATKEDLEKLREELRREFNERLDALERRIERLEERLDSMLKWMIGLQVTTWLTLVALLLPVVLKLLSLVR